MTEFIQWKLSTQKANWVFVCLQNTIKKYERLEIEMLANAADCAAENNEEGRKRWKAVAHIYMDRIEQTQELSDVLSDLLKETDSLIGEL